MVHYKDRGDAASYGYNRIMIKTRSTEFGGKQEDWFKTDPWLITDGSGWVITSGDWGTKHMNEYDI